MRTIFLSVAEASITLKIPPSISPMKIAFTASFLSVVSLFFSFVGNHHAARVCFCGERFGPVSALGRVAYTKFVRTKFVDRVHCSSCVPARLRRDLHLFW